MKRLVIFLASLGVGVAACAAGFALAAQSWLTFAACVLAAWALGRLALDTMVIPDVQESDWPAARDRLRREFEQRRQAATGARTDE